MASILHANYFVSVCNTETTEQNGSLLECVLLCVYVYSTSTSRRVSVYQCVPAGLYRKESHVYCHVAIESNVS